MISRKDKTTENILLVEVSLSNRKTGTNQNTAFPHYVYKIVLNALLTNTSPLCTYNFKTSNLTSSSNIYCITWYNIYSNAVHFNNRESCIFCRVPSVQIQKHEPLSQCTSLNDRNSNWCLQTHTSSMKVTSNNRHVYILVLTIFDM